MSYHLGVDLGTSYTAAAISRGGVLEMVSLGTRSLEIPSVVYLEPSGSLLVGEAAERRGASDPSRLAREFKRRLGDPAPILVAGTPFSAEALMGAVLRSVVAEVTARQGEPPAHLTLTRPANWGGYKRESFSQVPTLADVSVPWTEATEPEAAAVHFASTSRVASDAANNVVAVYDLGGGTFDAAVLRKSDDGFTVLGAPEGIEHLGGADFDDAVFEYVRRMLGPRLAELDPTDPAVRSAAARLRVECVLAKESLSRDTEATIPVVLPGLQSEVRITRADFESLIRPSLMATVDCLRRAVRTSGVPPEQIAATVLAGGSSRIPLVSELITGELELPVAMGTHPKHTVALGAALLAEHRAGQPVHEEPTGRFDRAIMTTGPAPVVAPPGAQVDAPTGRYEVPRRETSDGGPDGGRRRPTMIIGAVAAVVMILVATLLVLQPWRGTVGSPQAATTTGPVPTPTTPASPTALETTSAPPSTTQPPPSSSSEPVTSSAPTSSDPPSSSDPQTSESSRSPSTTPSSRSSSPASVTTVTRRSTTSASAPTRTARTTSNLDNLTPECRAVLTATLLFTEPTQEATAVTQGRIDEAFALIQDAPPDLRPDLELLKEASAVMLGKSGFAAVAPLFDPGSDSAAAIQNLNAYLGGNCLNQ